jgi:HAE1 family hydrophobic/amphiphilic exporter-1
MVFGTAFGVLVVPGLYFVFATLAGDSSKRFEDDEPLTEDIVHHV